MSDFEKRFDRARKTLKFVARNESSACDINVVLEGIKRLEKRIQELEEEEPETTRWLLGKGVGWPARLKEI